MYLKTLVEPFCPPPTDCPWVSENDILEAELQHCFVLQLVAIGKTTAEAMKSKQWTVTAVADQPYPQALAQCIVDSTRDKK